MGFLERLKLKFRRHKSPKDRPGSNPDISNTVAPPPHQSPPFEQHEDPRSPVVTVPETLGRASASETKADQARSEQSSISSVWDEAWDELVNGAETANLARRYEALLVKSAEGFVLSSGKLRDGKHDRLRFFIERQTENIERNDWKLRFQGHDFKVKDIIEPVVAITQSVKYFIGNAVEVSPPASLAWAGICLLLPLFLNPSDGEELRIKGLDYVSSLLRQCKLREYVYQRRYESLTGEALQRDFEQAHIVYRESLRALYMKILVFEMTCSVFLSGGTSKRYAKGAVNWDDWNRLLDDVKTQQKVITELEDNWRDVRLQEEWESKQQEHHERVSALNAVSSEVSRMKRLIQDQQNQKDRSYLLRWLSEVADPSTNFVAACDKLTETTGEWILKDPRFHNWMSAPNSLLWLHGKAGSGKSFLRAEMTINISTTVIKHLKINENAYGIEDPYNAVAFFYLDFRDPSKQTRNNLLRSLIAQISQGRPDFPEPLRLLFKFPNTNQIPSTEELQQVLLASIQGFRNVYIVLDALNECPQIGDERDLLMQCIQEIRGWGIPHLHLMATSRREHDIALYLSTHRIHKPESSIIDYSVEISLESCSSEMRDDIKTYINAQLSNKPKFGHWKPDLQRRVRLALIEKAQGMFQYVAVQLEVLRRTRLALIETALETLPDDINKVYERALQQSPDLDVTMRALKWLAFSNRRLEIEEFAFLARLKPVFHAESSKDRLEIKSLYDENLDIATPEDILRWLPGLVTVHYNDESGSSFKSPAASTTDIWSVNVHQYVRLCHFSLLGFLTSEHEISKPWHIEPSEARLSIVQSRVASFMYLIDATFFSVHGLPESRRADADLHLARFGSSHMLGTLRDLASLREQSYTSTLSGLVRKLFEPDSQYLSGLQDYLIGYSAWHQPPKSRKPLQMLYQRRLKPLIPIIVNLMPEVVGMVDDVTSDTALTLAACDGDEKMVKLLLGVEAGHHNNYKPDISALRACFYRSFHLAADKSRLSCARILIDASGPDVIEQFVGNSSGGSNPLDWLSELEWDSELSPRIANVLVEHGADMVSALETATRANGSLKAMAWLIDRGAVITDRVIQQAEENVMQVYLRRGYAGDLFSFDYDLNDIDSYVLADDIDYGVFDKLQLLFSAGGHILPDDVDEGAYETSSAHSSQDELLSYYFETTPASDIYEYNQGAWNSLKRRAFHIVFRAKSCDGTYVHTPAEAYNDFERWRHVMRWLLNEKQSDWPAEVRSPTEQDLKLFDQWWRRRRRGGWGPRKG
ncbi:ankyrin repeat-containing domain protein [Apiospora saccharicola]